MHYLSTDELTTMCGISITTLSPEDYDIRPYFVTCRGCMGLEGSY